MTKASNCYYILYLHGFRSSSASDKVQRFRRWLIANSPEIRLIAPDLSFAPDEVEACIRNTLEGQSGKCLGVVGSSLGGYYATWASVQFGLSAALINPALYPYRLFADYLGEHTNMYTGERFVLRAEHLAQLQRLDRPDVPEPARLMILVQSADETLDAHEATGKYPGARLWIQPGGSHAFDRFERVLPAILAFLKKWNPTHEQQNASPPDAP